MAATTDRNVDDHMTQLQLRMLRQRLDHEKDKLDTSLNRQGEDILTQAQRLQNAVKTRQELLDRIQEETQRRQELRRPRSHGRRRYRQPMTDRPMSLPELGDSRHVVEHKFSTGNPQQGMLPQIMPVHIDPQNNKNWKGDMMEMMMMQNAQMHQMVVQQMMMSSISNNSNNNNNSNDKSHITLPITADMLNLGRDKRSPSVHNHYGQHPPTQPAYQPPANGYTQLPPINVGQQQYYPPYYPHLRPYAWEAEPLRPPKVKKPKKKKITPRYYQPIRNLPRTYVPKYPFPGPRGLRRFRRAAYAVCFSTFLWNRIRAKPRWYRNNNNPKRVAAIPVTRDTDTTFTFGIQIREAIAAIHKIYLDQNGRIYPILRDVMADGGPDLSAVTAASDVKKGPLKDLGYIIENLIYYITEIMPSTGVLGIQPGKSVLLAMMESGKQYPRGYMWEMEKDLLQMNNRNRTPNNLTEKEAAVLFIGLYISRGLIATLLLKPDEYGLVKDYVSRIADRNLKMLASVFLFIVRKAYAPKGKQPLALPEELAQSVYRDQEIVPVMNKVRKSVDYAEELIRTWTHDYYEKLRGRRS